MLGEAGVCNASGLANFSNRTLAQFKNNQIAMCFYTALKNLENSAKKRHRMAVTCVSVL